MGGSQKDWREPEREGAGLRGCRNERKGIGRGAKMGGCHDGRESEWKGEPEQEETRIGGSRNMRKRAREQGTGIGSGKWREDIEEGGRSSGSGSRIVGGRIGRKPE